MVMAMRAGVLPRTLHADEPAPHIDWSAGTVRLLAEEAGWPDEGRPRRAGVSSFSMSGTNVHVIIEQAQAEEPAGAGPADRVFARSAADQARSQVVPWVVTGRGPGGLRGQAARLAGFARAGAGRASVLDVGRS